MSHPDQWFGDRTYSQHGEDLMILNIFALIGKRIPTYLDIGAHHPVNISNTALLYERGSRGINVEANPNLIEEFKRFRRGDQNLNLGVGPEPGKLPFYMIDSHSGRNSFSAQEIARFIKENPTFKLTHTQEIEVITLNQLVSRYAGEIFPDFMSLDCEGLDLAILKTADFSRSKPAVICIEAHKETEHDIRLEMISRKYFAYCRMGENLLFVHQDYKNFLY